MYNPTTRLLYILELLQNHAVLSAQDLAEKLEVQERSIRRYITMLRDIGIPIESERGRYGGYSLRPGFRMPPLMFNNDEIVAVMVGLMLTRELGSVSPLAIDSAIAKIERVLPEELRHKSNAVQHVLAIHQTQATLFPIADKLLLTISLAAHEKRCLTIKYASGDGSLTQRSISPYGIVLHGRAWYIAAYCHLREAMRLFRADRVRDVRQSDTPYRDDPHVDPETFVLTSLAQMPGTHTFEVIIDAPVETVREVIPASMAILEAEGTQTLMRCYSDDPYWLARYMMQLEMPFIVRKSDTLRHALRTLAQEILDSI